MRIRGRVLSSATVVAAGIMASRLVGLVRERVFAHYLGNSPAAGAFRAALRIPNFLQNLFGEGALSASFIPVYSKLLAEGRDQEAARLAGAIAGILSAVVVALCAIGVLGADFLVTLLVPGFEGDVRALTLDLLRMIFPGTGLLVISAWCLGVQNSHRKFFLSYVAPVAWNGGIIAALMIGGLAVSLSGASVEGASWYARAAAWGTLLGSVLQLVVQLPTTWGLVGGSALTFSNLRSWGGEHVRRVLGNFVPAVMGRGVVQISAYIDEVLLSFLGAGVMAAVGYSQMLYLLPFSLVGTATAAAELPELARAAASDAGARERLRARLEAQWGRLNFLLVPAFVGYVMLGDSVVSLLFRTGRFGADDVRVVWVLLIGMCVGLIASAKSRVLVSAFWAQEDTRLPLKIATLRVVLAASMGCVIVFVLRPRYDWNPISAAFWLVFASGLAAWVEFSLLKGLLARRIGAIRTRLAHELMPWICALGLGSLVFFARSLPMEWTGLSPSLADLAIAAVGLAVYGIGYLALGLWWNR